MNDDVPYTNGGHDHSESTVSKGPASNIVLVGGTGCGKSSVGWHLAKLLGFGFIDLDDEIERRTNKTVAQIFADEGEDGFRRIESEAVADLDGIRSHVIAPGGGAVIADHNWDLLQSLGATVWLNTPADEIARRFCVDMAQIKKRPLLAELADEDDRQQRQRLLTERLTALIGNRSQRYRQADVTVEDSYSTSESTARLVRQVLSREGVLDIPKERMPFDRWLTL